MVGSTVEENVAERQYEEKLTISRTRTPVIAGRSRRPTALGGARAPSVDLLAGKEHEDVLEVRGPLALDARPSAPSTPRTEMLVPGAPGREPGGASGDLGLDESRRRAVDLHGFLSCVVGDELAGEPVATAPSRAT